MWKILIISFLVVLSMGDNCPCQNDKSKTCCQLPDSSWGCCPFGNGICCSDRQHCCPGGYKCDVPNQACVKGSFSFSSTPLVGATVGDTCPSDTCGDDSTCCQLASGSWGCCQYVLATCCSDKAHCCPNGYTCDIQTSQCKKGSRVALFRPLMEKVRDDCPDGTCDSDQTCCQLANGDFGCCPYSNADCCSDKAHCCPNGYTCDIPNQRCVQGKNILSFQSLTQKVRDDCPDGTCDSDQTCCQLANGDFGCCPYSNADCCSDKAHCCPNGYTCDIPNQRCVQGNRILSFQPLK